MTTATLDNHISASDQALIDQAMAEIIGEQEACFHDLQSEDGFIVCTICRKIVGVDTPDRFSVTDDASAQWVLDKLDTTKCRIEMLTRNREAVDKQLDKQIRNETSRVQFLDSLFGADLAKYESERIEHEMRRLADMAAHPAWNPEQRVDIDELHVTDDATADLVLQMINNAQGELAMQKDLLAKRSAPLLEKIAAVTERLADLDARFKGELEALAETKTDKKTRSVKFTFGMIGFRNIKGKLAVRTGETPEESAAIMRSAVRWARRLIKAKLLSEAAVKVTPPQAMVGEIKKSKLPLPVNLFDLAPDWDKFSYETALEIEG